MPEDQPLGSVEMLGIPPQQPIKDKKPSFWKEYKWFIIVGSILIILSLLSINGVFGLDKGTLCNQLNLSINDCDIFWNALFSNNTIIQNYTITTIEVTNNTINNTSPVDLAVLQEQNRHDEQIAKINKGIIDQNGSQTIITSNFVTKDDLKNSLDGFASVYLLKSDFPTQFNLNYNLRLQNTTNVAEANKGWLGNIQPETIILIILLILVGIFGYNRFIKKKKKINSIDEKSKEDEWRKKLEDLKKTKDDPPTTG